MKIVRWVVIVLLVLIISFVTFVEFTWDSPISAPYPDISASTDSAVIARGEYLVYGPAHCAFCHFSEDKRDDFEKGVRVTLGGGFTFDFPPAAIRARNITPDMETGIGKLTDAEIARTLRYSVGSDGRYILPPFMPFQMTSDEDLTAIVSYIRTLQPVHHTVEPTEYKFLGRALMAFGVLPVRDMTLAGPKQVARDTTIEYGKYIATSVANCLTCHTKIDVMTLERKGPEFAGGFYFEADNTTDGFSFVSPNLTPDPETGHITDWSQEMFIKRFKAGRIVKGSPMPWEAFANIDENDLKAVYKFLRSLKPEKNKVEKMVYAPGEEYTEN